MILWKKTARRATFLDLCCVGLRSLTATHSNAVCTFLHYLTIHVCRQAELRSSTNSRTFRAVQPWYPRAPPAPVAP